MRHRGIASSRPTEPSSVDRRPCSLSLSLQATKSSSQQRCLSPPASHLATALQPTTIGEVWFLGFYEGGANPPLPFPPSSPFPLALELGPLPVLHALVPLEVGPLNPARVISGSAVSFPRGVWGGAPTKIEFGAF